MSLVRIPQVDSFSDAGIRTLSLALTPWWETPSNVILDLEGCRFLSAEGVAVLAGFKLFRDTLGYETCLDLDRTSWPVRSNLHKQGFLGLFGGRPAFATGHSIPVYQQGHYDPGHLIAHINGNLMARPEMPRMSRDLAREIRRSFVDVFDNIFTHGESSIGGLVCGQVYPRAKQIQVTFYDVGVGIARKVRECFHFPTDSKAISWAMGYGNSTLSARSDKPQGLGLYLLREFLRANKGILRIYANQGYVRARHNGEDAFHLSSPVRGTLIDLRIRVTGGVVYGFANDARDS